jgi:hypothetical protein
MKRTVISLLFVLAAGLGSLASTALAQDAEQPGQLHAYYTVVPLHGASNEEALSGAGAATTIPMSGYTFTASRDGLQHTGVLVGRSPFSHGARTTNIKTVLIPVIFKLKDAANTSSTLTFDPTATDSTCSPHGVPFTLVQNSPVLVTTHDFTMPASGGVNVGMGQYIDEFQRASFWSNVSATHDRFHNVLSPVAIAPTQTVTPPSTTNGLGYQPNQFLNPPCRALGVIDEAFWDPSLGGVNSPGEAQTILANLTTAGTIGPTTLPIFVFYNVVIAFGNSPFVGGACCILGYHGSQGSPVQTFSVSDYESTGLFAPGEDISALSHEVGEWMDDPLGNNGVPAWGHIGQVSGTQCNLEVGDPLSGTQFPSVTLGGMPYHPQELAFFSWFMGEPSLATNSSTFSNNATLATDAGAVLTCPF